MKNRTFGKKDGAEWYVRVRRSDGTLSAYPLQEEMCEGVNDSDFRAKYAADVVGEGLYEPTTRQG